MFAPALNLVDLTKSGVRVLSFLSQQWSKLNETLSAGDILVNRLTSVLIRPHTSQLICVLKRCVSFGMTVHNLAVKPRFQS